MAREVQDAGASVVEAGDAAGAGAHVGEDVARLEGVGTDLDPRALEVRAVGVGDRDPAVDRDGRRALRVRRVAARGGDHGRVVLAGDRHVDRGGGRVGVAVVRLVLERVVRAFAWGGRV